MSEVALGDVKDWPTDRPPLGRHLMTERGAPASFFSHHPDPNLNLATVDTDNLCSIYPKVVQLRGEETRGFDLTSRGSLPL